MEETTFAADPMETDDRGGGGNCGSAGTDHQI